MSAPPRLLLLGMMGSGKSTVGGVLAARTGWPYLDNDDLLVQSTGTDARTLLETRGAVALRDAEAAVLHQLLRREPPFVAGVAAGVVTRAAERAALRSGSAYVVWLRGLPETLRRNVGTGVDRPWLQPDPATALRTLGAGRDPLYAEVADLTVDIDEATPDDLAAQILSALP